MSPTPASVADYLSALDPEREKALRRVLALVKKVVPKSALVVSYGIPAFKQDRVFIYCAAFKHHIGIYPPVRGQAQLQAALKRFANSKGNLSFRYTEPMPLPLIGRVAKALSRQYAQPRAVGPRRKRPSKRAGPS